MGYLAKTGCSQNDIGRRPSLQRVSQRQETYDGSQPMLLHEYVQPKIMRRPRLTLKDLPQWEKNWYSSSESLWFDRWQQVLEVMPDYVEIITCVSHTLLACLTLGIDSVQGTITASRTTSATHAPSRSSRERRSTSTDTLTQPFEGSFRTTLPRSRLARPILSPLARILQWRGIVPPLPEPVRMEVSLRPSILPMS